MFSAKFEISPIFQRRVFFLIDPNWLPEVIEPPTKPQFQPSSMPFFVRGNTPVSDPIYYEQVETSTGLNRVWQEI